MILNRALSPGIDAAAFANSLREQHGPDAAWQFATAQADQAAAFGNTKAAIRWRRVINVLDRLET